MARSDSGASKGMRGTLDDPVDASSQDSALVRIYFGGHRALTGFTNILSTGYTGFWLGVLTHSQLHSLSERRYSQEQQYRTDEWNKRGLFDWERRVVEDSFTGCKRVLVAAAGGGREVLALRLRGMQVEGFESHPELVRFANDLLEREGMVPDIKQAPWDHCPDIDGKYDGVIVGWGAYMHIRGRERRIMFLRELRERAIPGSPILLSFYTTTKDSRYFRAVAQIGNVLARVLRRDPVQVGDCLAPNYTHFFTRKRLESELLEGGFEPISFEHVEYGHSVGRAV